MKAAQSAVKEAASEARALATAPLPPTPQAASSAGISHKHKELLKGLRAQNKKLKHLYTVISTKKKEMEQDLGIFRSFAHQIIPSIVSIDKKPEENLDINDLYAEYEKISSLPSSSTSTSSSSSDVDLLGLNATSSSSSSPPSNAIEIELRKELAEVTETKEKILNKFREAVNKYRALQQKYKTLVENKDKETSATTSSVDADTAAKLIKYENAIRLLKSKLEKASTRSITFKDTIEKMDQELILSEKQRLEQSKRAATSEKLNIKVSKRNQELTKELEEAQKLAFEASNSTEQVKAFQEQIVVLKKRFRETAQDAEQLPELEKKVGLLEKEKTTINLEKNAIANELKEIKVLYESNKTRLREQEEDQKIMEAETNSNATTQVDSLTARVELLEAEKKKLLSKGKELYKTHSKLKTNYVLLEEKSKQYHTATKEIDAATQEANVLMQQLQKDKDEMETLKNNELLTAKQKCEELSKIYEKTSSTNKEKEEQIKTMELAQVNKETAMSAMKLEINELKKQHSLVLEQEKNRAAVALASAADATEGVTTATESVAANAASLAATVLKEHNAVVEKLQHELQTLVTQQEQQDKDNVNVEEKKLKEMKDMNKQHQIDLQTVKKNMKVLFEEKEVKTVEDQNKLTQQLVEKETKLKGIQIEMNGMQEQLIGEKEAHEITRQEKAKLLITSNATVVEWTLKDTKSKEQLKLLQDKCDATVKILNDLKQLEGENKQNDTEKQEAAEEKHSVLTKSLKESQTKHKAAEEKHFTLTQNLQESQAKHEAAEQKHIVLTQHLKESQAKEQDYAQKGKNLVQRIKEMKESHLQHIKKFELQLDTQEIKMKEIQSNENTIATNQDSKNTEILQLQENFNNLQTSTDLKMKEILSNHQQAIEKLNTYHKTELDTMLQTTKTETKKMSQKNEQLTLQFNEIQELKTNFQQENINLVEQQTAEKLTNDKLKDEWKERMLGLQASIDEMKKKKMVDNKKMEEKRLAVQDTTRSNASKLTQLQGELRVAQQRIGKSIYISEKGRTLTLQFPTTCSLHFFLHFFLTFFLTFYFSILERILKTNKEKEMEHQERMGALQRSLEDMRHQAASVNAEQGDIDIIQAALEAKQAALEDVKKTDRRIITDLKREMSRVLRQNRLEKDEQIIIAEKALSRLRQEEDRGVQLEESVISLQSDLSAKEKEVEMAMLQIGQLSMIAGQLGSEDASTSGGGGGLLSWFGVGATPVKQQRGRGMGVRSGVSTPARLNVRSSMARGGGSTK